MYAAVYHFGPRWNSKSVKATAEVIDPEGNKRTKAITRRVGERVAVPQPGEQDRRMIEAYVKETNPSLEDLKKLFPPSP